MARQAKLIICERPDRPYHRDYTDIASRHQKRVLCIHLIYAKKEENRGVVTAHVRKAGSNNNLIGMSEVKRVFSECFESYPVGKIIGLEVKIESHIYTLRDVEL